MDFDYNCLRELFRGSPATQTVLGKLELTLHRRLEKDYRELLLLCGGLAGYVSEENFLVLWGHDELERFNEAYEVRTYASDLLLIGSTGLGEALAYDYGDPATPVVFVPFVGLSRTRTLFAAASLKEYILKLGPIKPQGLGEADETEVFEIKPILFGGDPVDPKNKTFVNRSQHIELARFWNKLLRDRTS